MKSTTAESLAKHIAMNGQAPISCPWNVSQIGNDGAWIAALPDRSALYCNYKKLECHCFSIPENIHPVDFIRAKFDELYKVKL